MDIEFENQLRTIAHGMEYPRTPDIAGSVATRLRPSTRSRFMFRRLAWSLTILLVLLSSLMFIPTVRAAILEFIQIGIVRIFPRTTEPTPGIQVPSTATPGASLPSLIPLLNNLAGQTTLADAQRMVEYPLLLPTYPSELGLPDHVYVQEADGAMTILVWVDSQEPERVAMSLHLIPEGSWAIHKVEPQVIEETQVNGQRAVWAVGPYILRLKNGNMDFTRMIEGHVLIWAEGDVTYRLETDLSLDETIKIAESLEPIP